MIKTDKNLYLKDYSAQRVYESKPKHVYADFAASTPICDEALETYIHYCRTYYANASGMGDMNIEASMKFEKLQDLFLAQFDCEYIIFTSGATEANNIVIRQFGKPNKNNSLEVEGKGVILTGATEHSSVLEAAKQANSNILNDLAPVYVEEMVECWRNPVLVSRMLINNETGAVYDIKPYTNLKLQLSNLYVHVDAAQYAGRYRLKLKEQNIDFATISGHKMHGPKGIGALLIKDKRALMCLGRYSFGGNQQKLVSGTINLPAIAAMWAGYGESLKWHLQLEGGNCCPYADCAEWKSTIVHLLKDKYKDRFVMISPEKSTSVIQAFAIKGIDSDEVVLKCKSTISNGSACKGVVEPSHVYKAIGVEEGLLNSILRISYSPLNYTPKFHAETLFKDLVEAIV